MLLTDVRNPSGIINRTLLQTGSFKLIPLIILTLCIKGNLRNTIITTPAILTMLTRCWIDIEIGQGPRQDPNWAHTLNFQVLLGDKRGSKDTLKEIVSAADGGAKTVAPITLNHLCPFISLWPVDYAAISPHICLQQFLKTLSRLFFWMWL
jgi:hypothetical protein